MERPYWGLASCLSSSFSLTLFIYVRFTESFPIFLLTLHICKGKFVFVSELTAQIGLLEASTLCLRNNGGTT